MEEESVFEADKRKKSEKEFLYLIHMGMIGLQDVPYKMRTTDICTEACRINDSNARYIPDEVKDELPRDVRHMYEREREEQPKKPSEEEKRRQEERERRIASGDVNRDGRHDIKDDILIAQGYGDLDL